MATELKHPTPRARLEATLLRAGPRKGIGFASLMESSRARVVGFRETANGKRERVYESSVANLERLAAWLGIALPPMPREWHGYRRSLCERIARVTSCRPLPGGWGS